MSARWFPSDPQGLDITRVELKVRDGEMGDAEKDRELTRDRGVQVAQVGT